MARVAPVMSGIVRYGGLLVLVLGLVIWTGTVDFLIPFHMLLGILVVLALWLLAAAYAPAGRAALPLVIAAVVVGLAQAVLGGSQPSLDKLGFFWVIQIVHLLLGLGVIGVGEMITMRMKKARAAVAAK